MNYQQQIESHLNPRFKVSEKREGIYQIAAPFYHEDGDMFEIFLKSDNSGSKVIISDYGMTLMRLSYSYEIDTANKEKVLNRIIACNHLNLRNGEIILETDMNHLENAIFQFVQTIAKISNMKLFQREVIQNLFFELLDQHITENLSQYHPQRNYYPIDEHDEYCVDYCFNDRPRPIFLFGVNNQSNARLVTISCLKFLQEKIPFKSVVVLESLDVLARKDLARLMSVADKQFPDFDDFKGNAVEYFIREYQSDK